MSGGDKYVVGSVMLTMFADGSQCKGSSNSSLKRVQEDKSLNYAQTARMSLE